MWELALPRLVSLNDGLILWLLSKRVGFAIRFVGEITDLPVNQ